jgi:hypothetical protein
MRLRGLRIQERAKRLLEPHKFTLWLRGHSLIPAEEFGLSFAKLINAVVRNVHTTADRHQLAHFIPGENESIFDSPYCVANLQNLTSVAVSTLRLSCFKSQMPNRQVV